MKAKKLFLSLFALIMASTTWAANVSINATNFPDERFRSFLFGQTYGIDSVLTESEIAEITRLDLRDKYIASLKGIEYFTALTTLQCSNNILTELDVSKNTELTRLDCSQNQLTELDVTKNAALEKLFCSDNQLTTLDVSQCPELALLWCNNNQLSALNVAGCAALTDVFCYKNQIMNIDMDALVEGLPITDSGKIYVVCGDDEQNVMTTSQVASAKAKGWTPSCLEMGEGWVEYSDAAPDYNPEIGNYWEYLGCEVSPDAIASPIGETEEGTFYDLSGRRLSKPQRGINIVNGKKVVIK